MSAIVAGKSCKLCKNKYYVSIGHPDWFDNVVKRRRKPCPIYKRYVRIAKSRLCPTCLTGRIDFHEQAVAIIKLITYGRKIKRR
jgi:hypothetical protein